MPISAAVACAGTNQEQNVGRIDGKGGLQMSYRWKPSASQRKAFAQRMSDPAERDAYEQAKMAREDKRRAGSQFDYHTAGGNYVPTTAQYAAAMDSLLTNDDLTPEQRNACTIVQSAWVCKDKCHHDYIHIVNELIRAKN